MRDQLITFETAELAKKKGFDYKCRGYYYSLSETVMSNGTLTGAQNYNNPKKDKFAGSPYYSAPTQSLLQRWLREVHDLDLYCTPDYLNVVKTREKVYDCVCVKCEAGNINLLFHLNDYTTYEAALERGLIEALKLIK